MKPGIENRTVSYMQLCSTTLTGVSALIMQQTGTDVHDEEIRAAISGQPVGMVSQKSTSEYTIEEWRR
ncbi:MAG: hypothetical protein WBB23_22315 [Desulforhopalus sp.]